MAGVELAGRNLMKERQRSITWLGVDVGDQVIGK